MKNGGLVRPPVIAGALCGISRALRQ